MRISGIRGIFVALTILAVHAAAEDWIKLQSGWLYVLDGSGTTGSVLIVDPTKGTVEDTLRTTYHPNFGICPGGSQLYVVDGTFHQGILSVFDTATGILLTQIPVPDRAVYKVWPTSPGVGCSSDGKWVFLHNMKTIRPGLDEHTLSLVDAHTLTLVSPPVSLPNCPATDFVRGPFGEWNILTRCSRTLHLLALNDEGGITQVKDVPLRWANRYAPDGTWVNDGQRVVTSALMLPNQQSLALIRGGGGIDRIGIADLALHPAVEDTFQRWFPPGSATVSSSADVAYVGYTAYAAIAYSGGLMNDILFLNTTTWVAIGSIHTSAPFSSLIVSSDGKMLYAVSPKNRSILEIDTATMREVKTIANVGREPSLAMIQP